jgi:hypothetical protein
MGLTYPQLYNTPQTVGRRGPSGSSLLLSWATLVFCDGGADIPVRHVGPGLRPAHRPQEFGFSQCRRPTGASLQPTGRPENRTLGPGKLMLFGNWRSVRGWGELAGACPKGRWERLSPTGIAPETNDGPEREATDKDGAGVSSPGSRKRSWNHPGLSRHSGNATISSTAHRQPRRMVKDVRYK